MDALIENVKNGHVTMQAVFVMVVGLIGVFTVLGAFYITIRILMKVLKPKPAAEKNEG